MLTDALGGFDFSEISCANFEVTVTEENYEPVRHWVEFSFSTSQYVSLVLEPKLESPEPAPDGQTISVREALIPAKARQAFEKGLRELRIERKPARSIPYFLQAIEFYPQYDKAYVELAIAHLQQKSPARAAEVLERGVTATPHYIRAHLLLGLVRMQQGQSKSAVAAFEKALELDSTTWLAHLELGKFYLLGAQVERAHKHAVAAHQLQPEVPSVHYLLYNVSILRNEYQTALTEVDELLALHPDRRWSAELNERRRILRQELGLSPQ